MREKDVAFNYVLDLYDASVSDDQLIDPVIKRPILINGPIVQTPTGVRMRRPVEKALKFFLELNLSVCVSANNHRNRSSR